LLSCCSTTWATPLALPTLSSQFSFKDAAVILLSHSKNLQWQSCVSQLSISVAKYLRESAFEEEGLFWRMVSKVWVLNQLAPLPLSLWQHNTSRHEHMVEEMLTSPYGSQEVNKGTGIFPSDLTSSH
jgi:hypothetical protein